MVSYARPKAWDIMDGGKPYVPFPWQAEHIHSKSDIQFLIGACGRRSGKTTAADAEVNREVFKDPVTVLGKTHAPLIYIVGPTAELAMRVWQPIWDAFVPDEQREHIPPFGNLYKDHDKSRGIIWLKNGATIQRKSADDPKSLQGERVTFAVVDEAHSMPEDAWQYLLPAFMDSGGRLMAIGIPKGKNRFRSMWELGQKGQPGYYSFSVPSTAHPLITATEKEAVALREAGYETARALEHDPAYLTLSDIEQKQQYWAEWVEQDGAVFKNIDQCFTGEWVSAENATGVNIMGLDVARIHDYTVAYIGDVREERIIARDRYTGLDWTVQAPRIAKMYRDYKCRFIHMDATGVGDVLASFLRAEGCSIIDYKFTNASKEMLINAFAREVERGQVILPKDDLDLKREMELFEATVQPGGSVVKYSAPAGYFDDCCVSAALLTYKMAKNRGMAKSPNGEPYVKFENTTPAKRAMDKIREAREKKLGKIEVTV